jgi:hypothetical protein
MEAHLHPAFVAPYPGPGPAGPVAARPDHDGGRPATADGRAPGRR